jgi:hypothetical protein
MIRMERIISNKKALSKMIVIAIVVVVVIAVVASAAAILLSNQNPGNSTTPTPTPTPSATPAPSGSTGSDIATASSLQYSVSLTENGVVTGTYTFQGKNAGTDSFMMRIQATDSDGESIYIFNAAQQKAWVYSGGEWVDISSYYDSQYSTWNSLWTGYTTSLSAWTAGDYSYTEGSSTVRIYDISVNPTLADSLFEHNE